MGHETEIAGAAFVFTHCVGHAETIPEHNSQTVLPEAAGEDQGH